MADFSTPGANAVLDGTAMPATLYLQLHTGNPGTNGTANVATESTRKSFTRTAAAGGACQSVALVEWLNAAATEDITHVSAWSASSGGTCWMIDDVGTISVQAGETIQVDAGAITLALSVWS